MNDHTHTDKTLQGNNKIESAIAALQQEPSQEMLAHTLTVIRRRMNEHGELIIAIDPSSAASGLQVQAIQTDDGRKWWAAFTSFDEELKGSGSVMSTFLTDMKQLFILPLQLITFRVSSSILGTGRLCWIKHC